MSRMSTTAHVTERTLPFKERPTRYTGDTNEGAVRCALPSRKKEHVVQQHRLYKYNHTVLRACRISPSTRYWYVRKSQGRMAVLSNRTELPAIGTPRTHPPLPQRPEGCFVWPQMVSKSLDGSSHFNFIGA